MKYWLFVCSFFSALHSQGFESYDPLSYDYGFPPPATESSETGKIFAYLDLFALSAATDSKIFGTEYLEGEAGPDSIESVKRIYFPTSYDFGFKATLGYSLPEDQWAATASWLWYQSSQSALRSDDGFGSSRRGGSFFLPGINGVALVSDAGFPTETKGQWKVNWNQFDFLASRDFLLGPAFTVNPSFGLRVLGFSEKVSFNSIVVSEPERDYLASELEADFWAVGPCIGVDCFVDLGYGLGGFIDTKGALLFANQHYKQSLSAPFALSPFDLSDVRLDNDTTGLKGSLDFAIGLEWRIPFNCDMHFLFFRFAFEEHLLFRATSYPSINADADHMPAYQDQSNDLAFYGFSISLGLKI